MRIQEGGIHPPTQAPVCACFEARPTQEDDGKTWRNAAPQGRAMSMGSSVHTSCS